MKHSEVTKTKTPKNLVAYRSTIYPPQLYPLKIPLIRGIFVYLAFFELV